MRGPVEWRSSGVGEPCVESAEGENENGMAPASRRPASQASKPANIKKRAASSHSAGWRAPQHERSRTLFLAGSSNWRCALVGKIQLMNSGLPG